MIGYRCKDRDIFSRVVLITRKAFLHTISSSVYVKGLVELGPLKKIQLKQRSLGGYSSEVPPLPIPNREVKLTHADGTAYLGGRVGSRLFKRRSIISVFSFLFAQISGAPFLNGDLAVRIVLSKSPFFVTAYHKFCANRKIERPKIFS